VRARAGVSAAIALSLASAACVDSFTPEFVDRINLSPDSVHISAGQTVAFRGEPVSERGKVLADRAARIEWQVNDAGVATIDPTGDELLVTAVALGDARITGRLGRGQVRGEVYVQPPGLTRIEITPSSVEVSRGERPRVEARLFDAQNQEMAPEGFRISWEILDPRIGFVGTPSGPRSDLLARRVGTTEVKLIVGHLSTRVPFIVR
jgi:Bacterial Ig-like domain (group 2)